ncbi:MAG: endonuclease III [Azospira sp.]|jgi:endonuclease-3|nr:endonuclease III [Azospira sp.]
MNATRRAELFARLQAANPHPTTELEYASPFQLLIAVLLSAQATDVSVNKATKRLFADAPTPEKMAALGEEKLADYIKTIGLFRTKARNTIATCNILLAQHGGEVPRTREALEALPGVGRKTANVVLNTAFGEPTIAVDTHIFRVANRTGLAPGKTPLAVELKLLKSVPEEYRRDAHHWLILHGRYVCTARRPQCERCPIVDLCEFKGKACPEPPAARIATRRPASR